MYEVDLGLDDYDNIAAMGERPPLPLRDDHVLRMEDDYRYLVEDKVRKGRIAPEVGEILIRNFHTLGVSDLQA